MDSAKTIIRYHDNSPYFAAPREAAQDRRLSYEARGVLFYLLSRPDDWKIVVADLQQEGCGRDKTYRVLNELIDCGYVTRETVRNDDHTIKEVVYTIYEKPLPDFPYRENQDRNTQKTLFSTDSSVISESSLSQEKEDLTVFSQKTRKSRVEKSEPMPNRERKERKRDLLYDAIAETWGLHPEHKSGIIVLIKSILTGTSKRAGWKESNFAQPVTDASEIFDFGDWYSKRYRGYDLPSAPEKIQRHFSDFRTEMQQRYEKLSAQAALQEQWIAEQEAERESRSKQAPMEFSPPELPDDDLPVTRETLRALAKPVRREPAYAPF